AMLPDEVKEKTDEEVEEDEAESMSLMAVAVQKEHLESVQRVLKKAGLKLIKAAPTMSAFISLIRENGDLNKEYCILDLGHKAIRMHIFKGERYEVTRTLDVGLSVLDDVIAENLNVDIHLAHTYLLSNYENCQNSEYCMNAYDNIATELVRALNFYRFSNPDSNLEDVYIAGGGMQNLALRDVIVQSLDMTLHHGKELLKKSMNKEGYSSFVQAIGITQDRIDTSVKSRGKLPTKKEINLAGIGEKTLDIKTAAAAMVLIIVLATLFSIFGVAGRFAKLAAAEGRAAEAQRELDKAYETLAGYEMTQEEYAHYTFENMTDEELAMVERSDVLKLLDEKVMGRCEVEYWTVSENILELRIVGSNLSEVNRIIQKLNESELVSYSTVSTAQKEEVIDGGSISTVTADIEVHLNGRKAGDAQ
nr:pilus assembly protein PilM [Lachnospiraceae bacterium]